MSKPQEGFTPLAFAGQTKTMFYVEGSQVATVVTNRAGKRSEKPMKMTSAESAVAWCRKERAYLVYAPFDIQGN